MQNYEVIAFAEKLITLLNTGSKNTTYKYAVLIGLLDLVFEAELNEQNTVVFTTQAIAKKVLALYWRQATPYDKTNAVLRAAKGRKQAKIIQLIERFQTKHQLTSLNKAKLLKKSFLALEKKVERILIEMPLPKLQRFGGSEERIIYNIHWSDTSLEAKQLTAYLQGKPSSFDNGFYINAQVLEYLRALNGLLRPLIKQAWLMDVAKMNETEESQLDEFLFGAERNAISTFANALYALQGKVCFYCQKPIKSAMQVDHFIPWSRYANDSLANLLATHEKCNNNKRDHICAPDIYKRWQH